MSNIFRNPDEDELVKTIQSIILGETNKNDKSDDGEGLDAVQPKAVKKKFKDRKDKDIDNDGDVDDSDEYLHKKRKAISKAITKEAKIPSDMIAQLKKAYEPMRGKKISTDGAKKLTQVMNKVQDDKKLLIQLMKADIPFVSDGAITRLITKHGMKGAELKKMMKEEVDLDEAKYTRKLMKDKSVVDYVKSQQEKNRKRGNTPQDGAVYHGANWVDIAADAIGMDKWTGLMSLSKKKAFDWDSEYVAVAKKLGEDVDLEEDVIALDRKGKPVGRYKDLKTAKKLKPGHKYVGKDAGDDPKSGTMEDVEDNPANKQHLCAKNVVHEEWGEGTCLSEMHADPDENGDIAWYDVMFEHGIEKQVSIDELKVTKAEDHIHSSHHKKKKMKEEVELEEGKAVKEEEDEDGGEKTDAQKHDMDGDGEKDTKKKKKKKKDDDDDTEKPDKIDTEPEIKTMVSEREMTDPEKKKLDRLKKKFEGGEMHKSIKDKYGDKGDDVFYGKLTKMAMGEEVDLNIDEARGRPKKDSGEGGDENLMVALRKSISLRGQHNVSFKDGKKVKISQKDAQNLLNRLGKLKPADREALMKSAYKSEKHFKMALKGEIVKSKNPLDLD